MISEIFLRVQLHRDKHTYNTRVPFREAILPKNINCALLSTLHTRNERSTQHIACITMCCNVRLDLEYKLRATSIASIKDIISLTAIEDLRSDYKQTNGTGRIDGSRVLLANSAEMPMLRSYTGYRSETANFYRLNLTGGVSCISFNFPLPLARPRLIKYESDNKLTFSVFLCLENLYRHILNSFLPPLPDTRRIKKEKKTGANSAV